MFPNASGPSIADPRTGSLLESGVIGIIMWWNCWTIGIFIASFTQWS